MLPLRGQSLPSDRDTGLFRLATGSPETWRRGGSDVSTLRPAKDPDVSQLPGSCLLARSRPLVSTPEKDMRSLSLLWLPAAHLVPGGWLFLAWIEMKTQQDLHANRNQILQMRFFIHSIYSSLYIVLELLSQLWGPFYLFCFYFGEPYLEVFGASPGSVLRNHSWQGLGDVICLACCIVISLAPSIFLFLG